MTIVSYGRDADIGVITIDNPPVNAIGPALARELAAALDAFQADGDAVALVVECAGSTFVAGGDIAAFGSPDFTAGPFNATLQRLSDMDRPAVAALFGTVLGGGLELAMACHGRVAAPGTRFGMPEVTLGLIPGSLGTQNLPRLAGLKTAARMISDGKPIGAEAALEAGIIDALADDPGQGARTLARKLAGSPPRRTQDLPVPDRDQAGDVLAGLKAAADAAPWLATPRAIHDTMLAAVTMPYDAGVELEQARFAKLVASPQSRAMRHLFFAEREARKIPGLGRETASRDVSRVGVIGAGTMGAGIATAFLNAGFAVTVTDATQAGLDRGLSIIQGNLASAVKRGRMTEAQAAKTLDRLTLGLDLSAVGDCDMVIEAVFEDMALKLDIAAQLGAICRPGAIIATNTSTLDVDRIAAATARPGDVIGTHFFSPAHIMRLLEVVRGAETAPDTLQTVMGLARKIGKTAVVSGVCYGFIGNRMAEVYMRESEALQMEGASPSQIDGVVQSTEYLGMAMGPNRMLDMAGVDVGARTVVEWIAGGEGPTDPGYRAMCRALYERGDHGQKTGEGYYRYENRQPVPSEKTAALAEEMAAKHGVTRRDAIPDQEILERLLFPMVNEAAMILDEGIAYRPSDIDVVWTAGYGFPAWRGGPLFMADEIGLDRIVARMDHYAARDGDPHGYWTVSPLLRQLAEARASLTDWRRE
ncbi:3-hydroxyacyl-CoA dehydrogenase NAD-binding domain-containing protein [Chachezhania sediminis]|uniref:3-hydroxyacyl-CoA dehydrogenase NAD-binding domain-containing protein n=1 Tax=Chachezhania sediminis TaxID=2599291 RepID=UPI00131A6D35|nr:3-hydroxyacyl-CoA dehydrogenase NAD-binding domain-containing protein [Chachezhania sediminis]